MWARPCRFAVDLAKWPVAAWREGHAEIKRAKDNEQVAAFTADGDQMDYLWKQGFFAGADPQ